MLASSRRGPQETKDAGKAKSSDTKITAGPRLQRKPRGATTSASSLEEDADRAAERVVRTGAMPGAGDTPSPRSAPFVQRKCATCECPTCEEEKHAGLQRKEASNAPLDAASAGAVLVGDGDTIGPNQITRAEFMARLRGELTAACDQELQPIGRSASVCPYIPRWLAYYETRPAARLERAIRLYAHPLTSSADAFVAAVVARVRGAIRVWKSTGEVTGIPSVEQGILGDEAMLQAKAQIDGVRPVASDPSAIRAQLGGGTALDGGLRARMEQGFGRSFENVRVHTDATASRLSRGLAARAFTVGQDVAFAAGEYKPGTMVGDLLLAHELAHTLQQSGVAGELLQRKAEASSGLGFNCCRDTTAKAKDAGVEVPKDAESEVKDAGPDAQPDAGPPPPVNRAKTPLTEAEKKAIIAKTGGTAPAGSPPAFKDGPRVVLHDTASPVKKAPSAAALATHYNELKALGSTPAGEGPGAYVPPTGAPIVAHPKFFTPNRPTATEYEKGDDIMSQVARETNMQTVWEATSSAEQTAAVTAAIGSTGMTAKDLKAETAKANTQLDSSKTTPSAAVGKPHVMSSATWTTVVICDWVAAGKAKSIAAKPGDEVTLEGACKLMRPVFDARAARIPGSTNIEITALAGTDCSTGKAAKPFPGYTSTQYDGAETVYLLAALEAGQFPEITTHFFVDAAGGQRCDPRCFDLDRLYGMIQSDLGHPTGTTYGVVPSYGTTYGTDTVWWHTPVCGAKP